MNTALRKAASRQLSSAYRRTAMCAAHTMLPQNNIMARRGLTACGAFIAQNLASSMLSKTYCSAAEPTVVAEGLKVSDSNEPEREQHESSLALETWRVGVKARICTYCR